MHSKAATQVINCWQAAADPKQTFDIAQVCGALTFFLAHCLECR